MGAAASVCQKTVNCCLAVQERYFFSVFFAQLQDPEQPERFPEHVEPLGQPMHLAPRFFER